MLSIDDNHQNLSLIQHALEKRFDVISSPGEESIEELVHDCEPDIILLDIMLSQSNSYDICKSIRAIDELKKTIIIFMSSLHSLDDKIKAYQAGGNDYICKPINIEELLFKLKSYQNLLQEQQALKIQMEEASLAAFASMQQSSDLAALFDFFSKSMSINNLDALYKITEVVLNRFKLNCAIEFRTINTIKQFSKQKLNRLETEILDLGKTAKRIVPFSSNILFNSKQCSLLIKNWPKEEQTQGRLQDHLAIFLNIIDSRIIAIERQQNREKDQTQVVDQIRSNIDDNRSQIGISLGQLEKSIEQVFTSMDCQISDQLKLQNVATQNQKPILSILNQSKEQINQAIKSSIDTDFNHQRIEQLLGKLK